MGKKIVVQGYVSKLNQVLVFAVLTNVTPKKFNFKKYIWELS